MPTLASLLAERARLSPDTVAMYHPVDRDARDLPVYASLSYADLDARVTDLARGFVAIGVGPGSKVAVMVRPGPDLTSTIFALFRAGAVPVLIDPGIDKRALRQCLAEAAPVGFVGIPLAQLARLILGWAKGSIRSVVTAGPTWFWGGHSLDEVEAIGHQRPSLALPEVGDDDLAAIIFTSGSTGVPKGVEARHRMFHAQIDLLREAFDFAPGEAILQTFPPFSLFDPALGTTTVVPDMDPTQPARADPRKLLSAIEGFGIRSMFGSPALLRTFSAWMVAHGKRGRRGSTLARVLSAGAPVPPELVAEAYSWLPNDARLYTPYGATEALPVAIVEGRELLGPVRRQTAEGAGICVGRVLSANCVRIIAISDAPIGDWREVRELPVGEIGEVTVAGPSVTEAYHAREGATALAKIRDGGRIVHRMGDVGYLDDHGQLWYCGRKSHRVEERDGLRFTECVEQVFNQHPEVLRSALVGIGERPQQQAVVCIERRQPTRRPFSELLPELRAIAEAHPVTTGLSAFLEHPGFPVDIRHNSKIGREQLAVWAAQRAADP
ncbi:MAG: fatty acid CoA ligase family protein [Xanthomonadales bacterium]|jgi:acyl-CoA synthetase (AMP-forming)/AMP-acid ligase II|nr:fatty acid CoA ligase family protein [Xanthomonadales bacterium]